MASAPEFPLPVAVEDVDRVLRDLLPDRTAHERGRGVDADVAEGRLDPGAVGQRPASLLYGELPIADFLGFVAHAVREVGWRPPAEPAFADVGCGAGHLLFAAAMAGFTSCVGVDLAPSLCEEATGALCLAKEVGSAGQDAVRRRIGDAAISVHEASFEADGAWTGADLIFVHALAFERALRERLVRCARRARAGALLCATARLPVDSSAWREAGPAYMELSVLEEGFWEHEVRFRPARPLGGSADSCVLRGVCDGRRCTSTCARRRPRAAASEVFHGAGASLQEGAAGHPPARPRFRSRRPAAEGGPLPWRGIGATELDGHYRARSVRCVRSRLRERGRVRCRARPSERQ